MMHKGIALANIDMHAHNSSLINNYQHHVIKTVHYVILKISQPMCTVFGMQLYLVIVPCMEDDEYEEGRFG